MLCTMHYYHVNVLRVPILARLGLELDGTAEPALGRKREFHMSRFSIWQTFMIQPSIAFFEPK